MVRHSPETAPGNRAPVDVAVVPTPRNWAALLILVLLTGVLVGLAPFISGLLGAVALYVMLERTYAWLARHVPPGLAALLTVTAALLLIIGPLTWLITVLVARAPEAVSSAMESPLFTRIGGLEIRGVPIGRALANVGGTIISSLSAQLGRVVGTVTSVVLNLVFAMFGLYYLLRAPAGRWDVVREYVPFSARTADALRDRFIGVTRATIFGTGAVCVAQGLLVGAGFAIARLPDPVFWGVVAAFAAVVPEVGSMLVWLPGVVVLLLQHRIGGAATVFGFGFGLAGNVDRLIRPLVYRRVSEIHPMITLVGAIAGIRYYGMVGLLLGPLAITYVFELLRFYREEYAVAS